MDYDWRKLVENASRQNDVLPFFQAVHKLARRAFGMRYEDKNDFAQFVCLMMLKNNTLHHLLENNFSSNAVFYQVKEFIRWRRGDWYRTHGNTEAERSEPIDDFLEKENEFLSEKAPQYEMFFKEDVSLIKKFISNIIPAISESDMRADAKKNAVKVFLLSQIFLGEFFEDYNLNVVLKMLKTDLSQYEITEQEIGQFTIDGIAKRLEISTTAVTNSISRIRETGIALAKKSNLNYPSR